MHNVIDVIPLGNVPWKCFSVKYNGAVPENNPPSWMFQFHKIYYCNPDAVICQMHNNLDFADSFDPVPRHEVDAEDWQVFSDFMTGNWAWRKTNKIAENPNSKGAILVPVISGSNKTTVSVRTGQNKYYPLYLSIGNIQNRICHAHQNAVVPVAFLAIPKSRRQHNDDFAYRIFRWQLYHQSLAWIFKTLKPHMETPTILCCPTGGHCARVVPKPFTNNFPHADIHKLLAPDLLHHIIKGIFKDHLVTWVGEYLTIKHGALVRNKVMDDMDRRIMELKHIKAVKKPWRWSSHFEALGQMLKTSQRLSELAAAHADFKKHCMLHGTALSDALH
ncbi:hypothetical protein PHLCEN_2v9329 [Hermanssonia centrifuga]|uniref:Uncharacterized protein n=1 Tax=Hermanssonia centrifuga TaxID=98765 RepID=A0A2R6NR62_9APHY|nr:hypothetical protein PHLCEN_2v9329 [Hermanssonia centrifuga]